MQNVPAKINRYEIENWLIEQLARTLKIDDSEISLTEPFAGLGLGSVESVSLTGELEDYVKLRLSPDLLWNYPNVQSLAEFIEAELQRTYG